MNVRQLLKKVAVVAGIIFAALIVVIIIAAFVFSGNSETADNGGYSGMTGLAMDSSSVSPSPSYAFQSESVGKSVSATRNAAVPTEKKVIKNGYLDIFVDNPTEIVEKIKALAVSKKGFVDSAELYQESNGTVSARINIRVPNDEFEASMASVKELAREVDTETVNATDVTEQYIDFEARLKNMRAEEAQYQEIMKKAEKIPDILDVAGRLANVRGEIEVVQGQLQYLARQVDMSVISINLTAYTDVNVFGLKWKPLVEVKRAFRSLLESLTSYVNILIQLLFAIPVIILWLATIGLIGYFFWRLGRWVYRRFVR